MKNFFRAGTEDKLAVLSKADPRYSQAFSSCVHCEDHFVAFAPGVHVEGLEAVQEGKLVPQVRDLQVKSQLSTVMYVLYIQYSPFIVIAGAAA